MQQATVGTKYQIVIPKEVRKKIKDGLQPGSKVTIHAPNPDTVVITTDPLSWIRRTSGMMTEAWKNIDPIKELEKSRQEDEERLKELEKEFK